MGEVVVYATGDQIGTFDSISQSGNSNGVKLTLNGVDPLGSPTDVYMIVITGVDPGDTTWDSGQQVAIYPYPQTDPPSPPIYAALDPNPDQFQDRASSTSYQIITSPDNIVIDVNGVTAGTMQYGPGYNEPRAVDFAFDSLPSVPPVVPCFVRGTLIETDTGPLPIESLRPGDLVRTVDNGLRPLRFLAQTTVAGTGALAPVAFAPGALGNYRWLHVSPQHRMLVSDWRAEMWFGEAQVLVAARHLVNGNTIRQIPRPRVTYMHMVFDRHEIVYAEGIPSESLHLGARTLGALGAAARAEIAGLFPELAVDTGVESARVILSSWEGTMIAARTRGQDSKSGRLSPAA